MILLVSSLIVNLMIRNLLYLAVRYSAHVGHVVLISRYLSFCGICILTSYMARYV